jgi:hypothetical protein
MNIPPLCLHPLDLVAVEFFRPSNIHKSRAWVCMPGECLRILRASAALVMERDSRRPERNDLKTGKEGRPLHTGA